MPIKMPSAKTLNYQTTAISDTSLATSCGVVNIVKDLSIVNRRGYDHTDSKGTPYVFRVAVSVIPSLNDGSGYLVNAASTCRTQLKFLTVANNWVAKNAGEKWHSARMATIKRSGVKMKQLGAYAKTIRYNWGANATTFLDPLDGLGAAYIGGTWDITTIVNNIDEDGFTLRLVGAGDDEDGTIATTDINSLHSYLQSRGTVEFDSNASVSDVPSKKSLLLSAMMGLDSDDDGTHLIQSLAKIEQDNPPYDHIVGSDTGNDITEPVESARVVMYKSTNSPIQTVVFDVPYGIFDIRAAHMALDGSGNQNSDVLDPLALSVEVLGIYPMQG